MMDELARRALILEFCGKRWCHHKRVEATYIIQDVVDVRTEQGWEPGLLYAEIFQLGRQPHSGRVRGSFVRTVENFRASFTERPNEP